MQGGSARAPNILPAFSITMKNLCAIFSFGISQKVTILAQFEFCWKMQNPQNGLKYTFFVPFWSIFRDFEDFAVFQQNSNSAKSSIFEILTKEKIAQRFFIVFMNDKKLWVHAHFRARRARFYSPWERQNWRFFGMWAEYSTGARASKFFRNQKVE